MGATGDAFDQFQILLNQKMQQSVEHLELPEVDDVFPQLAMSAQNLAELGQIQDLAIASLTPGYEASWTAKLQSGGLITGGDFGQTQLAKMGPGNNLIMGIATNSLGVDPTKAAQPSYIKLKSRLKKVIGCYTENWEKLESRIVARPIETAMDVIEDTTKLIRSTAGSCFWGNGYGVMGEVDLAAGYNILEASVVWVAIKNSQIFRFIKGQRYVAASLVSGVPTTPRTGTGGLNSPAVMRCVGINPQTLKVGFQSETGEGTIALTNGDGLILEGLYNFEGAGSTRCCNGLENLLKTTGAFPDSDITDISDYPELQAYIDGSETSRVEPTGDKLDAILDLMTAPQPNTPPALCAENNLWTLYARLERQANMLVLVPQGEAYLANGGVRAPLYSYGNKTFARLTSPKCRPGTVYGLDATSFIRLMPQDLNVRWRMSQGGVAGAQNIFRPITVGTRLSDTMTAEWDAWYQFSVIRPQRNVIRYGFLNQRMYDALS